MSMLVGLLAKQIMPHSELLEVAGIEKYRALFLSTDQYWSIKPDADVLLRKCDHDRIWQAAALTPGFDLQQLLGNLQIFLSTDWQIEGVSRRIAFAGFDELQKLLGKA